MTERRRLLFVSPRFLFPANEGGKIRTSNILRHMRGGAFEIALASPAPDDTKPFAADLAAVADRFVAWPTVAPSRIGRVAALFSALPVAVSSDQSAAGSAAVRDELAVAPDLIVVDFPHAAVLLPDGALPPSAIFTHNVEAEIFERHAAVANPLWRAVWRSQARKMRRFEGETLRRFDSVIAVSARDATVLQRDYALPPVACIDTGVDLDFHRYVPPIASPRDDGGSIVFCGAMDWRANIDGIAWLMDAVWPLVLRARPAARAVVVGRNPPQTLIDAAASRGLAWTFTGYVDDVRPYVLDADVYVIPLRVGSGTRIKAFEAMAAGRPVVSTAVGIEGLAITPGTHFLAADEAPEFAAAILRLLDDAALRAGMTTAARSLLEDKFSWTQVARQFEAICLRVVDRSPR
ncbi:MAG TPA: glycosyltransferase [Acetobacteraceae bacterium]